MSNNSITELPEWQALVEHAEAMKDVSILSLFKGSENRFDNFHTTFEGLFFDYSKHHASYETMDMLFDLARARKLEQARSAMFHGEPINNTEERAVLHTALRGSVAKSLMVDGENVSKFVKDTLAQIKQISEDIRGNEAITDIVNIGVGGSDLGGRLVCDALLDHQSGPEVHFLANIDGYGVSHLLKKIKPESTIFIISSKSFTTLETMTNANTVREWFVREYSESAIEHHFYAVSNNKDAATEFGISEDKILPLRDWIGGRFSVWSAIGLPIAVAIGFDGFKSFLDGAHAMDMHFKTAPMEQNIPIIMGLLGVWYNNFEGHNLHCILPYTKNLRRFSAYIQQLDMESNGKSVTRDGNRVDYATGPAVFGEPGTNGQHAFFQLMHQGTQIIPSDFIAFITPNHNLNQHHYNLLGNILAQAQAFVHGSKNEEQPHRNFDGSRPCSVILLDKLDAYHLGMLMALYEHKVFVQGIIWDINSFDQWGVELGKKLAGPLTDAIATGVVPDTLGSSTSGLLRRIIEKSVKS
ncbi:MAG: glucose-6-phosphate isomerase [Alphaproteobacteria bacterium]|nr:glucose-6-phosphate isomerase [Alphaproteobacteria bacterium]